MLMLATTRVQAAEGEMPEVLRYAREYTRDRANQPVPQPEGSLSRKLARSELIRRQHQANLTRTCQQIHNVLFNQLLSKSTVAVSPGGKQ